MQDLINSGNCNSGDWNSGNCNSGNCNSGNCNSGNRNSGDWNSGNRNSGDWNSGNRNSGDWNSGNRNSGYFNSDTSFVRMFNKETDKKFGEIDFPNFLYFDTTIWVSHDTATDKEKELHKEEIETCGGFLKTLDYKKAFRLAWDKADKEEHKELLTLPNWNNEIFREISGIDAEAEIAKETEDIEL
ncbi:MAG: pentapeptide repeat-containing protein [Treponema sp.]|nr:pentapeptide repeat-containing protein [Treponema sp.]